MKQLQFGLQSYTGAFTVGDIIFFNYSAQTPDLLFWDTFPMVQITDVDYDNKQFSGGNIHYLRPSTRKISRCQLGQLVVFHILCVATINTL